jgi:ribose/xylose/arabinose/galactoside ABC-type transport system permease subunit
VPSDGRWRSVLAGLNDYSAALVLLCLLAYGALWVPNFLSEMNLSAILYQYSIIGLLALGQLLVVLTAGIDLSQGALLALTSITTALVMVNHGPVLGTLAGLTLPTCVGVVSGLLVSRLRMPSFLVTLGTMGVARGMAMQIANARPVPIHHEAFIAFGSGTLLHIPISAFVWVVACVAVHLFLTRRPFGRHVYAVGSSEESSRLSGVKVAAVKLTVYVLSAFLCAVGGVIWTSRLGSGSPVGGQNYELESIAAVVVGGASLFGGKGRVDGVFAGVLIFGVINSVLNLSGISPFWQGMIKGAVVLLAVALTQIRARAEAQATVGLANA